MKGSAQDALRLPITAPSGFLVDIQDTRRAFVTLRVTCQLR